MSERPGAPVPPSGGNGAGAPPAGGAGPPFPGGTGSGPGAGPSAAPPGIPPGMMPPGMLLPQRRKVMIMVVTMIALFLAALDMTIWNVAAPKAVGDLGRLDLFAWPAISYLLGSTVMVPIIGRLSDEYGRKPFLMIGVVTFLIASILCGASGNMWELIGFRLIQGFGAAFIMANAFTVMGDYFAPAERGRWAGIVGGTFALASIIGPLAGGVLTDELSWRWVFYINVPVGGVALLAVALFMPWYRPDPANRKPTDWMGAGLLIVAATPLLLAFSLGGSQVGWFDSPVVVSLIVTVVAAVAFWRIGRRKGNNGIMPLTMFQNRTYLLCTIVMLAIGVSMMGAMFNLPFFLQGAQGVSATNSGLVTLPMSIGVVPASVLTGQIISRTGRYKPMAILGAGGAAVSLFLLSTLDVDSSQNLARLYMLIMGAAMGTLMPLYTLLLQNALPFQLLGAGTAANQFFRQIGAAVGMAIFGSLVVSGFSSELTKAFPQGFDQLKENPEVLLSPDRLVGFTTAIEQQAPGTSEAVIATAREALAVPVTDVFMYAAIVMLVALAVAIILPRVQFHTQEEMLAAMRQAAAGAGPPRDSAGAGPPGLPARTPVPAGAAAVPSAAGGRAPPTPDHGPPRIAPSGPPASVAATSSDNGGPQTSVTDLSNGLQIELVAAWARQMPPFGDHDYDESNGRIESSQA